MYRRWATRRANEPLAVAMPRLERMTDPIEPRFLPGADVDERATIGGGTVVWHLAQIREFAVIGEECVIGRGAYIGTGVTIGDRCKIQNLALVYEPATLADGVFIGPGAVLTNDLHPRAINEDGSLKSSADWEATGVAIGRGAAIGARAVCIAPVRIGEWATVAAGAVVTRDVPAYAIVAGVPAKQIGWVGPAGRRLEPRDGRFVCPTTGDEFVETEGGLTRA